MHLRANSTDHEQATPAASRANGVEQGADDRARTAVAAGAVASADPGAARSLQRMAGNAAVTAAVQRKAAGDEDIDGSSVASTIAGGGRPLDPGMQARMGASFGTDFSGVRVHQDPASTSALNARAYTTGDNIVLGPGVDPGSTDGERTIAHELTHVVQQSAGPVEGTPAAGGVSVSDPGDRFEQEAESNADRVVSGGYADVATAGISGATLQREADHDHEDE